MPVGYRLQGMLGLGDNIHQRAVVRHLMKSGVVHLETPWPSVYHDLEGDRLRFVKRPTSLRTQAKNAEREESKFIKHAAPSAVNVRVGYSHDSVRRQGSFLSAMCQPFGISNPDFSLPVPQSWVEQVQDMLPTQGKPVMVYRPLVERKEWNGCASRNPDKDAYKALFDAIADDYFVVSIADLVPGFEWISGHEVRADLSFHAGELSFEQLAGLFSLADLVFCSPGFSLILAQAVNAKLVAVFGGHESPRLYDHGRENNYLVSPMNPCECFSKTHACNKAINIELEAHKLRSFAHAAKQKVGHAEPTPV